MLFKDNSAKNAIFRILYAKLYKLLSVDGSTNHHNGIIFGGHDIYQIRYLFNHVYIKTYPKNFTQVIIYDSLR